MNKELQAFTFSVAYLMSYLRNSREYYVELLWTINTMKSYIKMNM